jgi:hypothetical protein
MAIEDICLICLFSRERDEEGQRVGVYQLEKNFTRYSTVESELTLTHPELMTFDEYCQIEPAAQVCRIRNVRDSASRSVRYDNDCLFYGYVLPRMVDRQSATLIVGALSMALAASFHARVRRLPA